MKNRVFLMFAKSIERPVAWNELMEPGENRV